MAAHRITGLACSEQECKPAMARQPAMASLGSCIPLDSQLGEACSCLALVAVCAAMPQKLGVLHVVHDDAIDRVHWPHVITKLRPKGG